jgi:beta-glucosidase
LRIGNPTADHKVPVSFEITNTGSREGAEIAEVYVGEKHPKIPRPVKELKGFSRVELKPGESRSVTVNLDERAFSYYDVAGKKWTSDKGEFSILVGSSSQHIDLNGKVNLQ